KLKGMDKIDIALRMEKPAATRPGFRGWLEAAWEARVQRGKLVKQGLGELLSEGVKNPRGAARDLWDTLWGRKTKSRIEAEERARIEGQERARLDAEERARVAREEQERIAREEQARI